MDWTSGWIVVILFGVMGAFGLVPVLARGSVQYPVTQWALLILLGGAGACILTGGLIKAAKRHRLTTPSGRIAEGKGVAQREEYHHTSASRAKDRDDSVFSDSGSKSWNEYYPVVDFLSEGGKAVRFEGSDSGTDQPRIKTGTPVKVYYDPRNPSTAFIGTFSEKWMGPLAMSLAGLIFLISGLAGFALSARALAAEPAEARTPQAIERVISEDGVASTQFPVHIQGTIVRADVLRVQVPPPYTFICKAVRPGGSTAEEFRTRSIPYRPGNGWVGRIVEIYLDSKDPPAYYVFLGLLLAILSDR